MARNPPPPRRMVHSVMSEMRDTVDLELKGSKIYQHRLSVVTYSAYVGQTELVYRAAPF